MVLIVPTRDGNPSTPTINASDGAAVVDTNDRVAIVNPRVRIKTLKEFRALLAEANTDARPESVTQLYNAITAHTFPHVRAYTMSLRLGAQTAVNDAPLITVVTVQVTSPDDTRYRKHPQLLKWIRRGMTLAIFEDGSCHFQFGLRKFFYHSDSSETAASWANYFNPLTDDTTTADNNADNNVEPGVFVTTKENGEFFRVSLAQSPNDGAQFWVLASKNIPVFLRVGREEEDLKCFDGVTYSYASKMAQHWLGKYAAMTEREQTALRQLLRQYTLIGEFVGGVDQHLKFYEDAEIVSFALVDQSRFDVNCIDPLQAYKLMGETGVKVVEYRFHANVDSLREDLRTVRTGPMKVYGEGAVLYIRQAGRETLCFKYKTEEYSVARCAREWLRKALETVTSFGVADVPALIEDYRDRIKKLTDNDTLIDQYVEQHRITVHYALSLLHAGKSSEWLLEYIRTSFIDLTNEALAVADRCNTPRCAVCQGHFDMVSPSDTAPVVVACSSPPGAGKSTLLRATHEALAQAGLETELISLDTIMRAAKTDRQRRAAFAVFQDKARRALQRGVKVVFLDMCFSTSKVQAQVTQYFNAIGVRVVFRSLVPLNQELKTVLLLLCTGRVLARTPESHDGSTLVPALTQQRATSAAAVEMKKKKTEEEATAIDPQTGDPFLAPSPSPGFDDHSATAEELLENADGAVECMRVVHGKMDSASGISDRTVLHTLNEDTALRKDERIHELATQIRKVMNGKTAVTADFLAGLAHMRDRIQKEACRPLADLVTGLSSEVLEMAKTIVPLSPKSTVSLGPKFMYCGAFVTEDTREMIKQSLGISQSKSDDGATVRIAEGDILKGILSNHAEFIDHVTLLWKGRTVFMNNADSAILELCMKGGEVPFTATHIAAGTGPDGVTVFLTVKPAMTDDCSDELAKKVFLDPAVLGNAVLHLTLYCEGPPPSFAKDVSHIIPEAYWTSDGEETMSHREGMVTASVAKLANPIPFTTTLGIV